MKPRMFLFATRFLLFIDVCRSLIHILQSAEALGAIGSPDFLPILERFKTHHQSEISETCQIAIDLINWRLQAETKSKSNGIFLSVDPAPPIAEVKSIEECRDVLLNTSLSLFDRYRAMFSLRDINSDEAALALCTGFTDQSPLFRHEVAYVLGQMQKKASIPALEAVLRNTTEHEMVRHEAAESLGAIGSEECERILSEFECDSRDVVRESCYVALDTLDYWSGVVTSGENNGGDGGGDN
jgi:deoxyhypusine monooxygenase